ncbi:MAG: phosphoribosyltransferase [Reyranellaceae bacterium]
MRFSGFATREQAGKELAADLARRDYERPLVLALPRGGVPVAAEVARTLQAPLELLLVRKIGVPWQPELAAAAIVDGEKHDVVYNQEVLDAAGLRHAELEPQIAEELAEIERRRKLYLQGRAPVPVEGRTAIVVDDGIATGTTVKAALKALKRRRPNKLVLAVPVAPQSAVAELKPHVDELVCLHQPEPFGAIGYFYRDFHQVPDAEVIRLLAQKDSASSGS